MALEGRAIIPATSRGLDGRSARSKFFQARANSAARDLGQTGQITEQIGSYGNDEQRILGSQEQPVVRPRGEEEFNQYGTREETPGVPAQPPAPSEARNEGPTNDQRAAAEHFDSGGVVV